MKQKQVDVIEAQTLERRVDVRLALFVGVALREQLGGDEEVLARDAALADDLANGDLVEVRVGGVDMTVARLDGLRQELLHLRGGHQVHAEAQRGNLVAIVHLEVDHATSFRCGSNP